MSIRRLVPAVLIVIAQAACDDLGLSAEPEQLSLELDAVGSSQVTLVTSTNWRFSPDPACESGQGCPQVLRVLQADTTDVTAPYQRSFRFTDDYRYLIKAFPAGGVVGTIRMRIEIDGQEWFNEARELHPTGGDGEQETLEFVYQWRRPTIR